MVKSPVTRYARNTVMLPYRYRIPTSKSSIRYQARLTRPCRAVLLGEELHAALAPVTFAPRRLQHDAPLGILDRRGEGAELGVARRAVAVRRVAGPGSLRKRVQGRL